MNISKREKILVSLAFTAALWMGISFLFSGKEEGIAPAGIDEKPAEEFLVEVAQSLAAHQLTETEKLILEKTETSWPLQPFVSAGMSADKDTSSPQSGGGVKTFVYAGYIQAGNRRMAIVNGTEYEVGDRVEDSLLTVRGISFEKVVLEDGEGSRFAISLQDGS